MTRVSGLVSGNFPLRKGGETHQEVSKMQTKGGLAVCSVGDEVNNRGTRRGDGQHYGGGEKDIIGGFKAGNRRLGAVGGSSAASRLLAGFLTLPHFRFKPRRA